MSIKWSAHLNKSQDLSKGLFSLSFTLFMSWREIIKVTKSNNNTSSVGTSAGSGNYKGSQSNCYQQRLITDNISFKFNPTKICYHHVHNILRLLDGWVIFVWLFVINWHWQVSSWLKTCNLRKLVSIRKISKLYRIIA